MSVLIRVVYEPDGSPALRDRVVDLKVSRLDTGGDIFREVYEQIKGELKNPREEYALFSPEIKQWIRHDKLIGHIPLESGAKLRFRSKMRCLRIRFLDASSKMIIADETQSVRELVKDLCSQLHLEYPEEMSLVVAGDYAVTKHHPAKAMAKQVEQVSPPHTRKPLRVRVASASVKDTNSPPPISPGMRRRRPGSAGGSRKWPISKVKKQISKKHQIRLDTPWLDPHKTLAEQEVTEGNELILMYRFYYHLEQERASANVHMLYKQARATYLAGELLCSVNDMVRLSAILCQITKGDYTDHKYSPEFLSQMKSLIAPPKCKVKTLSKQILAEHKSLKGLTVTDGKCWFVKLWSSLELFGFEFLSCTNVDSRDKGLIGISKSRVMFLYHKKKKNLCWDMDTLLTWKHDLTRDTVSLSFSLDGSIQVLNLHLPDYSGVLSDCLQGHKDLSDSMAEVHRTYQEYRFDEELESAISDFAAQTRRDVTLRRALKNLTYEDVYWASKIENPLLSDEELAALHSGSWENPTFENMDLLMDERFNFLDFDCDSETSSSGLGTSPSSSSSSDHMPLARTSSSEIPGLSLSRKSEQGSCSPLVMATHSVAAPPSSLDDLPSDGKSSRSRLTNGLFGQGHSRTGSGSSGSSASASVSDGGNGGVSPTLGQNT